MVEQMKKNKLFSKIIFFVIVCCGIFSMNAYSCKSNDVKIDYDKSFFNNFKVIEDKVYINCYIVIFNNSSEEKIIKIKGDFSEDAKNGLVKESELCGYTIENVSESIKLKPGENKLNIVFIGVFGGNYKKNNRLLPQMTIY